jgi:cytochrome c5
VIREFRRKLGAALGLGAALCVAALCLAASGARAAAPDTRAVPEAPALDARLAQVYAQVCATCHQVPATGAPLTGDPDTGRSAAAAGRETMLRNTVEGLRGMPPLGTCGFCTEDDLRRLIEFMAPSEGAAP